MTATLQGEISIGAAIPGINASLEATGLALASLKGAVDLAIIDINANLDLNASLSADLNLALGDLSASIGASLDAQVSGALSIQADLNAVVDAGLYLGGIVANLNASASLMAALDADLHLGDAKASISAGLSASLDAKASFDASINAALDVGASLDASLGVGINLTAKALAQVSLELSLAISAALPGLAAYAELTSTLLGGGVVAVHYDGLVQDFGADSDAAIATSSLGPTDDSVAVVLMCAKSNTSTLPGFKATFGIS